MKQQNPQTIAVEESLRDFYNSKGWKADGEHSKDASLWEDTRNCAQEYVSRCRLRVCRYLPSQGNFILDAASGPVQYKEYLAYSSGFSKRICVDISEEALKQAEAKLGNKGQYLQCSILDLPLPTDHVDAAVSIHTIYHIEASAQEKAVRQLLRVTKPGHPLLVIYANPDRWSSRLARILTFWLSRAPGEVYYHAHPLRWWRKFSDEAEVDIVTWRTLTAKVSRILIPDNKFGSLILRALYQMEDRFPRLLLPFAAYPLIVLKKKKPTP